MASGLAPDPAPGLAPGWEGALLRFWYGEQDVHEEGYQHLFARWYRGGEAFDAEVRQLFLPWLEQAERDHGAGRLERWGGAPRAHHALVLLLDQLSRNMFRGTARMFKTDPIAIALVHEALEDGAYLRLAPVERLFMAVALEHSERRQDVERSAALMAQLAREAPAPQRRRFLSMCKYNADHLKVIQRFGRYPHRNELLGRQSSQAELEFLRTSSFKWMRSVYRPG